jgi:hypothetical protein
VTDAMSVTATTQDSKPGNNSASVKVGISKK